MQNLYELFGPKFWEGFLVGLVNYTEESAKGLPDFPTGGWEGHNFLNTAPYYKWLSQYIGNSGWANRKKDKYLELGRRAGNSLYAMAYRLPDMFELHSYDINPGGEHVVNKPNVHCHVYDGDFTKLDLSSFHFIFVDINGGGELEYKLHQELIKQGYKGLVAWDDVGSKWCPDDKFWDRVALPTIKTKANLHGPHFGFTFYL